MEVTLKVPTRQEIVVASAMLDVMRRQPSTSDEDGEAFLTVIGFLADVHTVGTLGAEAVVKLTKEG